eukprot:gene17551-biopygen23357
MCLSRTRRANPSPCAAHSHAVTPLSRDDDECSSRVVWWVQGFQRRQGAAGALENALIRLALRGWPEGARPCVPQLICRVVCGVQGFQRRQGAAGALKNALIRLALRGWPEGARPCVPQLIWDDDDCPSSVVCGVQGFQRQRVAAGAPGKCADTACAAGVASRPQLREALRQLRLACRWRM